ncbi:MAG: rhamnulokinase, partial [Alistipes sp.]|nr:rhamnulokinase [Alistipes sp.]
NLKVETGTAEATALGNVMMQAKWDGVVASIEQMREMIAQSLPAREQFTPQEKELWDAAYEKYLTIYREL